VTTLQDQLQRTLGETYTIDREIGRGGMATVFLARDEKHHRSVALKVLDPELGAVLGAERFLSEIRVTAALQHPNLLPLFDSGEAGGLLYYVMPYVEGESLRHRLDREKQLPIDEALHIATAVANALDYAHAHGVIHRDLKPENILLQHGQPVVADFGIALAVRNAGGARVTQTGLSLGTPQYMSPEQASGDRAIDGRTDIYSLAAVLYEMLAGEPPHTGTSAQAIIAKLMTTEPRPVRTLRPAVAPNVAMAVERALAKVPADRFASPKAFAEALANPSFTTHATSFASTVSSPRPMRGPGCSARSQWCCSSRRCGDGFVPPLRSR
jgi:serine/threonine-protein kinase